MAAGFFVIIIRRAYRFSLSVNGIYTNQLVFLFVFYPYLTGMDSFAVSGILLVEFFSIGSEAHFYIFPSVLLIFFILFFYSSIDIPSFLSIFLS
ncbi:hypothetical protein AWB61_16985 [Chromobacterium sp. F49]|nr:hypothetical protein Cv017_03920 [Chromobacterium subtsugae]KZE86232.1 hypothetical protein AWB61_16985 [Chromobacterium sp. F49]